MSNNLLANYRVQIIIRVILLVTLCILLAVALFNTNWFFTPLVLGILIAISTYNLIAYNERTNRDISTFLISLKQGNFTNKYTPSSKGRSFDEMERLFEDINLSFQKVNEDKESHYQYLKALNDNIGVAILSYLDNGKIQMINPYAKKLFNKPHFNVIDDLKAIDNKVFKKIKELETGGNDVVKTVLNNEVLYLSITCRTFINQGETYHIVLIQNIRKALEDRESEAWQKLVRVLTHEIMNSVTPISSLSTAINQSLKNIDQWSEITEEDKTDILFSLETIKNRSNGLVSFVKAYKDYARDIDLNKSEIVLKDLIERIQNLFINDKESKGLKITKEILPENLKVKADEGLIEQVLINLIKNANEAIDSIEEGEIVIKSFKQADKVIIEVGDNGKGIDPDIIENIFVPFFTTKRLGTGVGLSLSKKIMQLHNGDIQVRSSREGTVFTLLFDN